MAQFKDVGKQELEQRVMDDVIAGRKVVDAMQCYCAQLTWNLV